MGGVCNKENKKSKKEKQGTINNPIPIENTNTNNLAISGHRPSKIINLSY